MTDEQVKSMQKPSEDKSKESGDRPSKRKNLRRQLIIDPDKQFKYAFFFFGAGHLIFALFMCLFMMALNTTIVTVAASYNIDMEVTTVLRNSIINIAAVAVICAVIGAGLSAWLGIVLTHRIFGPIISFKKLVNDLKSGDYSARGTLRKNDEFQELMTNLNELAADLEKRHGSTAKPS